MRAAAYPALPAGDRPYTLPEVLRLRFGIDPAAEAQRWARLNAERLSREVRWLRGALDIAATGARLVAVEARFSQPLDSFAADLVLSLNLCARRSGGAARGCVWLRQRYRLDLASTPPRCARPEHALYRPADPRMPRCDLNLLPVLRPAHYATLAEALLERCCPEALRGCALDGERLARRMGLSVHRVQLCGDAATLGLLLPYGGCAEVWCESRAERQLCRFDAGSILVDARRCGDLRELNATIVHECAHALLDRAFFALQRAACEGALTSGASPACAAAVARAVMRGAYSPDAASRAVGRGAYSPDAAARAVGRGAYSPGAAARAVGRGAYSPDEYIHGAGAAAGMPIGAADGALPGAPRVAGGALPGARRAADGVLPGALRAAGGALPGAPRAVECASETPRRCERSPLPQQYSELRREGAARRLSAQLLLPEGPLRADYTSRTRRGEAPWRAARLSAERFDAPQWMVNARLDALKLRQSGVVERTYSITPAELALAALSSPQLAERLYSGVYVYADGCVCLNTPRYVRRINGAPRMTRYAHAHRERCCAAFRTEYAALPGIYGYGRASASANMDRLRRLTRSQLRAEPESDELKQLVALTRECAHELQRSFALTSQSFPEALSRLMGQECVSGEEMALRMDVDRRAVYDLLHSDSPALPKVIAACLALAAPPDVSARLLQCAGYQLTNSPLHNMYRVLLSLSGRLEVPQANLLLTGNGFPPLCRSRLQPA